MWHFSTNNNNCCKFKIKKQNKLDSEREKNVFDESNGVAEAAERRREKKSINWSIIVLI